MMRLSRKQVGRSVMCTALVATLAVTQTSYAQKAATTASATTSAKPAAPKGGAGTGGGTGAGTGTGGGANNAPKPATTPATGAAAGKPATAKPTAAASLAEAKKAYQSGEAKFKAGDYAGALTDFQTADQIKPTPQAARYIGMSADKLSKYPEAVAAYDRFLADVPAKMQTEGAEIKKRSDEIKAMPGKVHVDANVPATVTVDQQPTKTMTPSDLDVPPGHHTLHFAADGRLAQDKEVDVTFASKQDVRAELEAAPPPVAPVVAPVAATPPPAPPPPAAPPPEPRSKVPAYVTGGLAIVAAGVGTVFGVMALSDKSDFDKNPTAAKADDGENHALVADMSFGVAVTLGVTSAVLFLTKDDAPAASASAPVARPVVARAVPVAPRVHRITITPTPIVTPHGGGAGALFRF
ncbi:MAG: Fe-S oxidoreductase [Myxococcaceae bacterium]|nr:Fe-S oxidoreductase [Myxococcaceae bacterium]